MLTGWRIKVYLMSPTVEYRQALYQLHIQSFPCKVTEERMANLRSLKYLYDLPVDLQFHNHHLSCI